MYGRSPLQTLQAYFSFYKALAQDKRTPGISKALPWIAFFYILMPIDFIPDFLPVIGQIDDATIAPFLILLALWLIPHALKQELKRQYVEGKSS